MMNERPAIFWPIPVQFRSKPVQEIAAYSRPNFFAATVTVTAVTKEKRSMLLH
jgi:DsbC/DsbD-like thiol-disulfide interchange protein